MWWSLDDGEPMGGVSTRKLRKMKGGLNGLGFPKKENSTK